MTGNDRTLWDDKIGVFCPNSPMASEAGLEVLTSARDYDKVKHDLAAAGYRGERIVYLSATDSYPISQQAPPDKGGWNVTDTTLPGHDLWDPTSHLALRGNGLSTWPGWATSAPLEALRAQWFAAPDEAARQSVCRDIQRQAWQDVPYIPTGRWKDVTAYRTDLKEVLNGMPLFYNLSKVG